MRRWIEEWTEKPAAAVGRLSSLVVLAVVSALCAGAAPRDEAAPEKRKPMASDEVMVPLPGYSPPVTDNGCPLRAAPADSPALKPGQRRIPYWALVADAFGRYSVQLTINGGKGRDVFLQRLAEAGLSPDMRTAAILFALADHMGRDRLHTHFFLDGGALAPEIRDALKSAGLAKEHAIYAAAMDLFGPRYPLDNAVRAKFFGYHDGPELNAFDERLLATVSDFPGEQELPRRVATFIGGRPQVWRDIEARRKTLGRQHRLEILTRALWEEAGNIEGRTISAASLPQLTPEERALLAVDLFNLEFENGGIHQFFFNSSGAYAPEVLEALKAMGLSRQAELFGRAMALFKTPFPRNRELRIQSYVGKKDDEGFERQLYDMTDDFYAIGGGPVVTHLGNSTQIEGGPGIRDGMLRFAEEHGLLPC